MRVFFPAVIRPSFSWLCAGLCIGALLAGPVAGQQRSSTSSAADTSTWNRDSGEVPQSRVADSVADDHPAVEEVQVSDTSRVEESELRAVARALVSVDSVRREFHGRQGRLSDSTEAVEDLHAEFKSAVTRVIEAQGITVELYVRVLNAARRDPALRERLARAVAEVRE